MRVWKFGDDINTDIITPGRYTVTTDEARLGKIAFIEYRPEFAEEVREGDVIVAGRNFGCGSSREHAPVAIKAAGISAVIARSFARIFFRNAINIGLPILICDGVNEINDGDNVEVDLKTGEIRNTSKGTIAKTEVLPEFIRRIVERGGLVDFLKEDGYV